MNDLCEIANHLSDHMKGRENPEGWRKATLSIIGSIAQNTTKNLNNFPQESSKKNIAEAIKLSFRKLYPCLSKALDYQIYFNLTISRQIENLSFPEKYEATEASDDEEQKETLVISEETQKNIVELNEKRVLATQMLAGIESPAKEINPETLLTIFQLPLITPGNNFAKPKNDQELTEKYLSLLSILTLTIKEIVQFDLVIQCLSQPPIQQCIQNAWKTLSPAYIKQREYFKNKLDNIKTSTKTAKNEPLELYNSINALKKELEGDALEATISTLFSFTDNYIAKLNAPTNKAVAILFFEHARERMQQHSQGYLQTLNNIEVSLRAKFPSPNISKISKKP